MERKKGFNSLHLPEGKGGTKAEEGGTKIGKKEGHPLDGSTEEKKRVSEFWGGQRGGG